MKKVLKSTLALFIACSAVLFNDGIIMAQANNVQVNEDENHITLSNDMISRKFTIKDGNILTSEIVNKKNNKSLVPQEGSEDFVINTISNEISDEDDSNSVIENIPEYELKGTKLNSENWTATLINSSNIPINEVEKLFDNDLNTHVNGSGGNPYTLTIDLNEKQTIAGMSVNKRPGYPDSTYGVNGTMGGYEIYASTDGTSFQKVSEGTFTKEDYNLHQVGNLYNVGDTVYVNFENAVEATHLKVVQTSVALGSVQEFTSAEIGFYSTPIEKVQKESIPTKTLDRSNWKATVKNKAEVSFSDTEVAKLFDDNLNTHPDNYLISGNPFTVDINLGSKQTVSSISIDKRPGYHDALYGKNGTLGEFVLYVSDDGSKWKMAGAGNFTEAAYGLHTEGNLHNVGNRVYANFKKTYTTQYVRLVQKSCSIGSSEEFTTAEINLYEDQYKGPNWNTELPVDAPKSAILSSVLTYKDYNVENTATGKKMTINYEPITVAGVTYTIAYVNVLESADHYLRSFVEVSVNDKAKAQIDYIDTDRFILASDVEGLWSIPDEKDISSMWIGKHELMLGQPIYVNSLFMGSEFPAAETDVEQNTTKIRYYSGKTFDKMKADGQLTTDDKFVSWQNVIGVADDVDSSVVQTAFFAYINAIATPTKFRKQYNSWYDNMMNITDDSIASSFLGAEAGLSAEGVEPLDSYVVDDGWNNYYSTDTGTPEGTEFVGPGSSAGSITPNQTGFWEFNNKFPNELYTSSSLVDKFSSTFGVWVGPQGGYNYFGGFADYLQHAGTGEAQTNSALGKVVCTGSRKYIKNFEKLAIDYQDRFNVEYWKWDGFASRPCNNADHDHMVGGNNNMYFTSDMWEAWIDLFENVRENNPNLFINATCYVNLSPWLLQWVNTIWVQDSGDTGESGTGERHEQKIYYRDNVYYQLYKQNQVQFPLKNIYNHDPIYGVSDGSNATTDVFREYMMANAVRGTAFWELYYSPSILDEAKWKVTADVLEWTEKNFDILENAKLFGNRPAGDGVGVYGYSSWKGNEGIISFTNPLDEVQEYTLTIDNIVGAPTTISNLKGIQVEPYQVGILDKTLSYGDTLTVTLQPHETKILQFGEIDTKKPEVVSINNVDNQTIRVKFSERVNADVDFTFAKTKAMSIESVQLLADYRTFEIKLAEELVNADVNVKDVTLNISNVIDMYENEMTSKDVSFKVYADGIIADMSKMDDLSLDALSGNEVADIKGKEQKVADNGVEGEGTFAISFSINTKSKNATILTQGNDLELAIDGEGYLVAKVGTQSFTSKEKVTTVTSKASGLFNTDAYVPTASETSYKGIINDGKDHVITLTRSANGMLKLFVDGNLATTLYDESKINEKISNAPIVLGSTSLEAKIASLKVVNHAVEYKEAKEIALDLAVVAEKNLDRSKWTATACSEMPGMNGDASAMAAIDGNDNSWWHTNYLGGDTHKMGEHFIEIDFNEEISFDNFIYKGRGSSGNGSIKGYKLEAEVNGAWVEIKSGDMSTNDETKITFDQTITATKIKLTPTSTHNGNNHAAAVEINVSAFDRDITAADVKKAYDAAKTVYDSINEDSYTEVSYKAYQKAFNNLKELNDLVANGAKTTQFVLDKMVNEVNTTKKALIKDNQEVDKTALLATIEKASKIKVAIDEYKTSNWDAFIEKLEAAIAVNADANAKQKHVNAANAALEDAISKLEERVNNTLLKEAVNVAEAYQESNYTNASWSRFAEAMKKAQVVLANRDATENEIKEALTELEVSVEALVADKESLNDLIATAEKLDLANKTEASIEALKVAIENAKEVAAKEDASLDEVKGAMQQLEIAISQLKDITTPTLPENNGNHGGSDTGDHTNANGWLMLMVLSSGVLFYRKSYKTKIK